MYAIVLSGMSCHTDFRPSPRPRRVSKKRTGVCIMSVFPTSLNRRAFRRIPLFSQSEKNNG